MNLRAAAFPKIKILLILMLIERFDCRGGPFPSK